jgi:hypothetical protein
MRISEISKISESFDLPPSAASEGLNQPQLDPRYSNLSWDADNLVGEVVTAAHRFASTILDRLQGQQASALDKDKNQWSKQVSVWRKVNQTLQTAQAAFSQNDIPEAVRICNGAVELAQRGDHAAVHIVNFLGWQRDEIEATEIHNQLSKLRGTWRGDRPFYLLVNVDGTALQMETVVKIHQEILNLVERMEKLFQASEEAFKPFFGKTKNKLENMFLYDESSGGYKIQDLIEGKVATASLFQRLWENKKVLEELSGCIWQTIFAISIFSSKNIRGWVDSSSNAEELGIKNAPTYSAFKLAFENFMFLIDQIDVLRYYDDTTASHKSISEVKKIIHQNHQSLQELPNVYNSLVLEHGQLMDDLGRQNILAEYKRQCRQQGEKVLQYMRDNYLKSSQSYDLHEYSKRFERIRQICRDHYNPLKISKIDSEHPHFPNLKLLQEMGLITDTEGYYHIEVRAKSAGDKRPIADYKVPYVSYVEPGTGTLINMGEYKPAHVNGIHSFDFAALAYNLAVKQYKRDQQVLWTESGSASFPLKSFIDAFILDPGTNIALDGNGEPGETITCTFQENASACNSSFGIPIGQDLLQMQLCYPLIVGRNIFTEAKIARTNVTSYIPGGGQPSVGLYSRPYPGSAEVS